MYVISGEREKEQSKRHKSQTNSEFLFWKTGFTFNNDGFNLYNLTCNIKTTLYHENVMRSEKL